MVKYYKKSLDISNLLYNKTIGIKGDLHKLFLYGVRIDLLEMD